MKKLASILLLALSFSALKAQYLDFEFSGTNGRSTYSSATFFEQISKEYNNSYSGFIILIETSNSENSLFKQQMEILNSIDAETHSLFYVISSKKQENTSGYHTSKETAKKLLEKGLHFRIRIFNKESYIISTQETILTEQDILEKVKN